jgi:frataxin
MLQDFLKPALPFVVCLICACAAADADLVYTPKNPRLNMFSLRTIAFHTLRRRAATTVVTATTTGLVSSSMQHSTERDVSVAARFVRFDPQSFVNVSVVSSSFASSASAAAAPQQQRRHSAMSLGSTKYHNAADEFVELVYDACDKLADTCADVVEDVKFGEGVLSVVTSRGTFVLNKQAPLEQLWYSSPVSGPHHYNMKPVDGEAGVFEWKSDRDGHDLKQRVADELRNVTRAQSWDI